VLRRLAAGEPVPRTPQPAAGVTVARKIRGVEAAIDWSDDADSIDRQIRAFDPAPGAYASIDGRLVKLWRAEPVARAVDAAAGSVLDAGAAGIVVACGTGAVKLVELQPAGGRRMSAAAFVAGRRLGRGARFGAGGAASG
jgi:methionyl-tRNA formyltransferase